MSFVCYNFFNNEQWPSEKVDGEPCDTGSGECKISEPTDKVENLSIRTNLRTNNNNKYFYSLSLLMLSGLDHNK